MIHAKNPINMYTPNIDIESLLDTRIQEVQFTCYCCNNRIHIPEAYINDLQESIIENLITQLESAIKDLQVAAIEIYGVDLRFIKLQQDIKTIIGNFNKPQLSLVTNKRELKKGE